MESKNKNLTKNSLLKCLMMIIVLRNVRQSSLVNGYKHFKGTCSLHLLGKTVKQAGQNWYGYRIGRAEPMAMGKPVRISHP